MGGELVIDYTITSKAFDSPPSCISKFLKSFDFSPLMLHTYTTSLLIQLFTRLYLSMQRNAEAFQWKISLSRIDLFQQTLSYSLYFFALKLTILLSKCPKVSFGEITKLLLPTATNTTSLKRNLWDQCIAFVFKRKKE